MVFECKGIDQSGKFMLRNTGRGEDLSPEFKITDLPDNAKTLVITLEDNDHPIKGFTHWVAWNIPASEIVPEGIAGGKKTPDGIMQGVAYGMHRYAGPKPPKGVSHKYCFTVYALDTRLELSSCSMKSKVIKAMQGHTLAKGSVYGSFE